MGAVVEFTGGARCVDCDEQIPPARLAVKPDADRCTICQTNHDRAVMRELRNYPMGPNAVIVIRH